MAGVEDEAVIVKDLFDLIHKYQVPTPPEDLAVYQVHTTHFITHLHTLLPQEGRSMEVMLPAT